MVLIGGSKDFRESILKHALEAGVVRPGASLKESKVSSSVQAGAGPSSWHWVPGGKLRAFIMSDPLGIRKNFLIVKTAQNWVRRSPGL